MTPLSVFLTAGLLVLGAGAASARSSLSVDQAIGAQMIGQSSDWASAIGSAVGMGTKMLGSGAIG